MKRKVLSLTLTLTILVGMFAVCGTFSFLSAAEAENAEKFVADFAELGTMLQGATMKDSADNTHYETAYTPVGDTSTLDGKINTWMRERFASTTNYKYSTTRAWFAQKSDEISDAEVDGWGRNGKLTGFALVNNGYLRLRVVNASGANMLRRVDTLIPQFNGENVKLKNFKMTVKYRTYLQNNRGAIMVSFDETKAGYVPAEPNVYGELGYRRRVTGSTLVLGNGTGMEQAADKDGWIFYNKKGLISSTTVDEKHFADPSIAWRELKPGQDYTVENGDIVYKRFDTESTQQWLTLTVEVKNGKATFTTTSEDGYRNETMEMAYTPDGGYVSIGMSNRDYVISYVDIEEYDENGNAVDYGTYHNSLKGVNGAVEVFEADFTDLPDLHYVEGQYLYNATHDTATGKGVGLTATDTTNATSVGAYASSYKVDVKDKALVGYLESKFDFYTYSNGGGGTFPMWNAAGYVVDAEGNPLGSGFANSNPHNPSTGVAGGAYMPGSGQGGFAMSGYYPTMTLSGNKWFHIASDIGVNARNPFDIVYSYALNNANGEKAVVKNFQLDLDFKLTSPGESSYPHNQSPVFVKFGGYDSVKSGGTDGAMFAISHNGGYFLDDLSTGFTAGKNSDGSPAYTEYIGGAAKTQIVEEAHLTLTVKNGTVTALVTDANGNVLLNVTKNDINIQNGLIYIGTTYAGMNHGLPFFGGVKVVRLDSNGNPIDFTGGDEGTFDAHFVGLTEVVDTRYYRDLGTKNNSILTGKANPWLTNAVGIAATDNKDNDGYAFGAEDPKVVNYLNEKFDFYHAAPNGTLTKMETPYQNADEIYADATYGGGQWKLAGGRWLRATFDNGVHWNDAFRKQMILVPKMNGEPVKTADQHIEFDLAHGKVDNGNSYSAALIVLRSDEVAKTSNAAGAYANALTLRITHSGLAVYDGTAPGNTNGHPYNDQFLFNGDIYASHVSIDLEGDQLKVKITSLNGVTVYADETITVENRIAMGYTYFSVCNSDMAFADIELTPSMKSNVVVADKGEAIVKPAEGFELKVGSLLAKTADGSVYVPQRVGFREGGDASRYTLIGNSTIAAYQFVKPTLDAPNIGAVGTSFNRDVHGLRFISRFTRQVIDGVEYVVMTDGNKYAISDYGMLLAAQSGLATTTATDLEDMVVGSANAYVKQLSAMQLNKYYDICDDYIDLSACIVNMDKVANFEAIKNMNVYARTYVVVEVDGAPRVLYGDLTSSTYYQGLDGATKTETMTELRESGTLLIDGRHLIADETTNKGFVDPGDIVVDFGNAGITIAGDLAGDIYMDVSYNMYAHGECRINVMVDGAYTDDVVVKYGETRVKVVKGLEGGFHTIKIAKGVGTPSFGDLVFKNITYSGYLTKPTVNDFQMEFLGDSITDTVGILSGSYASAPDIAGQTNPTENVRLGYAALTAQALGADFTLVSMSGNTISMTSDLFKETTWKYQGQDMPYTFGSGDTTEKDVVVINLGTNGLWGATADSIDARRPEIQAEVKECLTAVRTKYPNAYIVWTYGMLATQYEDVLSDAVAEWASENGDIKTSYCSLVAAANQDGAGRHPLAVGHENAAKILTQYLADLLDMNETQNVTFATDRPLKVACVGDSITALGYWKNNLQGNLPADTFTVQGFGKSGSTASLKGTDGEGTVPKAYMNQTQHTDSLAYGADVVVMMLGTNDSKPENWPRCKNEFVYDYVKLVRAYQNAANTPYVYIMAPLTAYDNIFSGINDETIANDIIPALQKVAKITGAKFVMDTHTVTSGDSSWTEDGVHPSEAGKSLVAKTIANIIKEDVLGVSTKSLAELREEGTVRINGRHTITDAGDVKVSFGNAGITLEGDMAGDIYLDVKYTKYAHGQCRINVMVDGEYVDDIVAVYGENHLKVVEGLKSGHHTITISKGAGTPSLGDLVFEQITYSGQLETPEVNDLQFMFLGDSITDTAGILGAYDDASSDQAGKQLPSQNIRLGYAALTSEALGADFTQVSFAGLTISQVQCLFNEEAFPQGGAMVPYEYGSGDVTDKDVVVINLGTNNLADGLKDEVKACLTAVRAKYQDAYIVWTYGMMFTTNDQALSEAVAEWAAQTGDAKTSYCSLAAAANTDGGAQHPLAPYHAQAAEILTQHIANLLNAE